MHLNSSSGRKCKYLRVCREHFFCEIFSVLFSRWAFRLKTLQMKVSLEYYILAGAIYFMLLFIRVLSCSFHVPVNYCKIYHSLFTNC